MPHITDKDGSIGPAELKRLGEIFETICSHEHIAHRSAVADLVAKRMMQLYKAGVRDQSVYLTVIQTQTRHRQPEIPKAALLRGSKPH